MVVKSGGVVVGPTTTDQCGHLSVRLLTYYYYSPDMRLVLSVHAFSSPPLLLSASLRERWGSLLEETFSEPSPLSERTAHVLQRGRPISWRRLWYSLTSIFFSMTTPPTGQCRGSSPSEPKSRHFISFSDSSTSSIRHEKSLPRDLAGALKATTTPSKFTCSSGGN